MADWVLWLIAAGVLVALEMFTGTFYLLMIGVAMVMAAVAAVLGAAVPLQFATAAIVGIVATLLLRRSRLGRIERKDSRRDPNVNLDIGQEVRVTDWGGLRTTRVMYRGALWDVELEAGVEAGPGRFVIHEVRGNRLIVGRPHGGH
ncbi:NfeD family protein [Oxalobacteraceae bacterium OM1]|nr:NfeD family protein [Oxalobacteraceae bacterium OM1]